MTPGSFSWFSSTYWTTWVSTSVLTVAPEKGSAFSCSRTRRADDLRLGAEHLREARVELSALGLGLGQLVRSDLEREAWAVVDEHAAVAVEDLAARRLDLDLAQAVVVGLGPVTVAREDLEVPEAEEDDREHRERDAADHGDPDRGLWRGLLAFGVAVHQRLPICEPAIADAAQADRAGRARAAPAAAALERIDDEHRAKDAPRRARRAAARSPS